MQSFLILALAALPSALSLSLQSRALPPVPVPTQADVATNCARWDLIGGLGPIRCSDILILHPDVTYSDLILWNPSVGPLCDNTWNLYWFCSLISGPFVPRPANPPAGHPVNPAPGIPISAAASAPTCDRWDDIIPGASCQTYMSRYPGLTKADILAWNPSIPSPNDPCFLELGFELCTSIVGHVFETPPAIEAPVM